MYILKEIGKKISQIIVIIVLSIVYIVVIGPYRLFIKFDRQKRIRNYIYKDVDSDRMF